jgi:hypothetical protein
VFLALKVDFLRGETEQFGCFFVFKKISKKFGNLTKNKKTLNFVSRFSEKIKTPLPIS